MNSLTVCFITAREKPEIQWFLDSLALQIRDIADLRVIIVTHELRAPAPVCDPRIKHGFTFPKPTVWQGSHRLTKVDWWANSNARNTGICLCQTEWIAFVDDRCVLMPSWLDAIRAAMAGGYAVCGAYEKHTGMIVENGVIKDPGTTTARDAREDYMQTYRHGGMIMDAPGEWMFGCSFALPLEWALVINGQDEACDGISAEDCMFGLHLRNNGFPLKFDRRMKIIEDRTGSECGPVMKREDKGVSPNDKSHAILAQLRGQKRANSTIFTAPDGTIHPNSSRTFDLRELRASALAGNPFPVPTTPERDWWDGQPLGEMK